MGTQWDIQDGVLCSVVGEEETFVLPADVRVIGPRAFTACNIRHVVIPEGVVEIKEHAFRSNSVILSVSLPSSLTAIGSQAFAMCNGLKEIVVPDGVRMIDSRLFWRCKSLEKAVFQTQELEMLGNGHFAGCSALRTVILPQGLTRISNQMFKECRSIDRIEIPDSVTSIGRRAFKGCVKLKDIAWPQALLEIGDMACMDCVSLEEAVFPEGLQCVKTHVFENAKSLETVIFPDSLTEIGKGIFFNTAITRLELPQKLVSTVIRTMTYDQILHIYCNEAVAETCMDKHVGANRTLYAANLIARDSVYGLMKLHRNQKRWSFDVLKDYLTLARFYKSTQVTAHLLEIKRKQFTDDAWERCENDRLDKELGVKERTLADWRKIFRISICGDEATISGYKRQETCVIVPEKVGRYTVTAIADKVFACQDSLESVVLPHTLKTIGDRVFERCESLGQITIPPQVASVGEAAFESCRRLQSVTLPETLTSIAASTFQHCHALETVVLPKDLKRIGDSAFSYCTTLKHIVWPDEHVLIGRKAFAHCEGLADTNGFIVIDKRLYANRESRQGMVVIPEGVVEIDDDYCSQNATTKTLVIPEGVKVIGSHVASFCRGLQRVYLPASLEKIDSTSLMLNFSAVMYVVEGSYAQRFLEKMHEPYKVYKEGNV